MRFLRGVVIYKLHPKVEDVLDNTIDPIHQNIVGRDAIVTSVREGIHSPTSLHYKGRAFDLRSNDLKPDQRTKLVAALKEALGTVWDVIDEPDHLHCELDARRYPHAT